MASALAQPLWAQTAASAPTPGPAGADASAVFVQLGHAAPVQDLALSADGRWMISGDAGGTLVVWDLASRRELRRLSAPFGIVWNAAFIDDDRFVWTSGTLGEGQLHLSDLDGRTIAVGEDVHKAGITGLAVDRAGRIYSSDESGRIVRWLPGLAGVEQLFDAAGAVPTTLHLTPDDHLLVGTSDGRVLEYPLDISPRPHAVAPLQVWQAGSEPVKDLARHVSGDTAVAFGRLSGSQVPSVKVFGRNGEPLRELASGPGRVASLAYSHDGRWLAAVTDRNLAALASGAGLDNHESLSVWKAADGTLASRHVRDAFARGTPSLRGRVHFSRDGRRLLVAAWDEQPRAFVLDQLHRVEHGFAGYGKGLRHLAPLGADQLVTSDWDGTPVTGALQGFEDFVAEFEGQARWGPEFLAQARPRHSRFMAPAKRYATTRWDLGSGQLERVEFAHRARLAALVPMLDGSAASLSILFPDFVAIPPLRNDLIREARLRTGEPAQQAQFGANPAYADTEPLYPDFLPGALYRSGVVQQATVAADGSVYATIVELDKDPADKTAGTVHTLAVFTRAQPGAAPSGSPWRLRWRTPLPSLPTALALSANGAVAWVSGAPRGRPGQALYDDAQAWLQAWSTADGQALSSFQPGAVAEVVVPLGDGRRAALSGQSAVVLAEIGQTQLRRLALPQPEALMRAVAVSADGRDLVAATPNGTYVWDLGSETFRYALPRDTMASQALAFTHTLLLTGHDDGSVAVRRRNDGVLLARLIRLADEQWLSITPEGYFAASAAGDRAVNVRVGRRVFGIEQFYDVFYRPDLVQRKLSGEDIRPLVRLTLDDATRQPPPVLSVSHRIQGRRVQVQLRAVSAGGGVGEVRTYHNGKLIQRSGGLLRSATTAPAAPDPALTTASVSGLTRALTLQVQAEQTAVTRQPAVLQRDESLWVDLVPGANTLAVVATNSDGSIASRPNVLDVIDPRPVLAGRIHLVTIGIDAFSAQARVPRLSYAVKDADDLGTRLETALRSAFPGRPVLKHGLRNAQATSAGVAQMVQRLQAAVRPSDTVIWFVASHGVLDAAARYAVVLHDWQRKDGGLLRAETILETARRVPALRQVYILDTCHAGGLDRSIAGLYDARLSVLARNMGLHLLASASATEEALDGYQGNGLFTHALLQGLQGAALDSNSDQLVSIAELGAYATEETTRIARRLRHAQRPLRMHYGNDIIIEKALRHAPPAP